MTKTLEKLMDFLDKSFLTRWLNIILWPGWVNQITKNGKTECQFRDMVSGRPLSENCPICGKEEK